MFCWRLDPLWDSAADSSASSTMTSSTESVAIRRPERRSAGVFAPAGAIACNENIHLLRICTDSEINVVVKPKRLCLIDDRDIDF
jgi:hypothetical protein